MYISIPAIIKSLPLNLLIYIGIISGALLQLREDFCLSCFEREMIVSSMLAGAVIASLTGGKNKYHNNYCLYFEVICSFLMEKKYPLGPSALVLSYIRFQH